MGILEVDQSILVSINSFLVGKNTILDKVIQILAVYLVYLLPIILLYLWFYQKEKREALYLSFIACIFSWLVITKNIIPSIWFRPRPDLAGMGIKELLFHRPDYSFPSDHATALFAITIGLYVFGNKKAANLMLALSLVVVFARVGIGVHFPLDIIAGLISGSIGVILVYLTRKNLLKIYKPLVGVLKKVRLA